MSENYRHLLALLVRRSDDGHTMQEIADLLGIGIRPTRRLLLAAKAEGWLQVGRKQIVALDGRRMSVPCYTVTTPAQKSAKKLRKT